MGNRNEFFGKQESKEIAAIAIVMMLTHHFFGFKNWLLPEVSYTDIISINGVSIERMFSAFGKLCVAIFAFCSGFAIWKFKNQYLNHKSRWNRLIKFLTSYWLVCILFIVVGIITKDNIPSLENFLYNLIGLHTTPENDYVNVTFAWYVCFYTELLILSPIIIYLLDTKHRLQDASVLILFIAGNIAFKSHISNEILGIANFLQYLPSVILGCLTAKWNIFEKLECYVKKYKIPELSFIIPILLIAIVRQASILFIPNIAWHFDAFFALLFIFCMVIFLRGFKTDIIDKTLLYIGSLSMNIWFLHGIFFSGNKNFQVVLYWPEYAPFILIWGFLLLIPVAHVCTLIQTKINTCLDKIINYIFPNSEFSATK